METVDDLVFVSSVNLGSICLQVYELTSGACCKSFRGSCLGSNSLCSIGNADYLISSQKDKPLLQAWALNQNDHLQMRFPVPGRVNVIAVDEANGDYCVMGISEKIFIYQLNCGLSMGIINCHYRFVTCIKFTPCGNYFASGGEDGFVYLWSIGSLVDSLHMTDRPQVQPHYILGQHSDKVTDLCISGGGMRGILISCSLDCTAKVFDLVTGHLRYTLILSCGLTAVICNAIGSQIFLAQENGKITGVNLLPHSNSEVLEIKDEGSKCHEGVIQHLCLSTAGDTLVSGATDGEVKVWSIVITERKGFFGPPSFALQKVLHTGRGAITNLIVKRISKEVFELSDLGSRKIMVPFNNQPDVDILDAVIPVPVERGKVAFDPQEFISLAATIMSDDQEPLPATEFTGKKRMQELGKQRKRRLDETRMLASMQQLKTANEELYKLSLKHLIGED